MLWLLPAQFLPSPRNPGLHVQLKDPLVLLQMAWTLQLSVFMAHSSIATDGEFHMSRFQLNAVVRLLYIGIVVVSITALIQT